MGVCSPGKSLPHPPSCLSSTRHTHARGGDTRMQLRTPDALAGPLYFLNRLNVKILPGSGREPEGTHWSHLSNKHSRRPLGAVLAMEDPASASRTHGSSTRLLDATGVPRGLTYPTALHKGECRAPREPRGSTNCLGQGWGEGWGRL